MLRYYVTIWRYYIIIQYMYGLPFEHIIIKCDFVTVIQLISAPTPVTVVPQFRCSPTDDAMVILQQSEVQTFGLYAHLRTITNLMQV